MAENDGQDRTESATPRRRQEARDRGQVARSAELSAATVLLAGAGMLAAAGGAPLADYATRVMRHSAGALSSGDLTAQGAVRLLQDLVRDGLLALAPFLVGVGVLTTLINVAQTRGLVAPAAVTPKLSHLDPMAGLKRIVGLDGLVNLVKAVLKLAALGTITWLLLRGSWPALMSLGELGAPAVAAVSRELVLRLAFLVGLAFLVLALGDYAYQWYRNEKGMRMTQQEVRHEAKDSDGDPHVKARVRALQRQHARQRMLQAVATADVVVTNPTHVAVALRYDPAVSPAPVVVAMGERKLAERIKLLARAAGVPMVENKPVARALLATATVGQPIPPALYVAVAEILAWVFRRRDGGMRAAA
jgi:flagellar biosynthetic protein FlhB